MTTTEISPRPEDALADLAAQLREEGPVVAGHVAETDAVPGLGMLAAAGPRCASDPGGPMRWSSSSFARAISATTASRACSAGSTPTCGCSSATTSTRAGSSASPGSATSSPSPSSPT